MFNVSFKVSFDKLSEAIGRLQPVAESFSVEPIGNSGWGGFVREDATAEAEQKPNRPVPLANFGEEKPVANFGIQTEEAKPAKTKIKRRYKPRRKTFGTQRQRASWLLLQIGSQPFRLCDLIQQAHGVGIEKSALYTAMSNHIQNGHLRRLDRGLYQRTGQSFSESLGLAENAA